MTIVSTMAVFYVSDGSLAVIGPANTPIRTGQSWSLLPTGYTTETYDWNPTSKMMVENPAKLEKVLIDTVKDEAEQLKMKLLTAGGAKKAEYAEKRQEVVSFDAIEVGVGGIVAALLKITSPRRKVMLAHATADAAMHGDTEADAIARFRLGITKSDRTPVIAAIEAVTCRNIRAAVTAIDKRRAFGARNWDRTI